MCAARRSRRAGYVPSGLERRGRHRASCHRVSRATRRSGVRVAESATVYAIVREMRKYVITGVPGSGESTQSGMLVRDFDLVKISVGDIFRWHVTNHTKIGAQVRRVMGEGRLGDDPVEQIVRDRLDQHDWNYGFIIDGFPRSRRQAAVGRADTPSGAL